MAGALRRMLTTQTAPLVTGGGFTTDRPGHASQPEVAELCPSLITLRA